MGSIQGSYPLPESQPLRGLMRVVVLEPNADYRDKLHLGLGELPGFHLVGESGTWTQCRPLLDTYLPELLIIRTDCVPSSYCNIPGSAEFPVIIGLHAKNGAAFACAFETLELPFDAPTLRSTMERARTEIYRRKLDEISTLLRRYMDSSVGVDRFMTALKVDDGNYAEIPAENVVFMAADGNYVRLHTDANIHEVRETMAGMTSKLDPARFARVHRSFIVNRACVSCVLRKEGAATAVLLHNGIEIPVGPNYRTEVDSFENYSRLSA